VPSGLQGRLQPEELLSWPERVWGECASDADSDAEAEDERIILPFDIFAACRWLDASPDDALLVSMQLLLRWSGARKWSDSLS